LFICGKGSRVLCGSLAVRPAPTFEQEGQAHVMSRVERRRVRGPDEVL
jgi:hypothetical protein